MLSRFSIIASQNTDYFSPISYGALVLLLRQIELPARPKIIDIGCGNGHALLSVLHFLNEPDTFGIGVDITPEMIERAKFALGEGRPNITFYAEDAKDVVEREAPFDLMLCVGASQALGGYSDTLKAVKKHLNPGGIAIIGEGFWKQKPSTEYLEFLGGEESDMMSFAQTEAAGLGYGLIPIASHESTSEEWEAFENAYSVNVEVFCLQNPDDPDTPAFRDRIRKWRQMYRDYGRDTLGFGLFLFLNEG